MINHICPNCNQQLNIPDEYANTIGMCRHCKTKFSVPSLKPNLNKIEFENFKMPAPIPAPVIQMRSNGKSKLVAALLAIFLGGLGFHRFYLGQFRGLLYLICCCTGIGIPITIAISLIEGILFLMMSDRVFDAKYN